MLSREHVAADERPTGELESSRAFSRVTKTTVSRGRIRSVANGARLDRPCSRERSEVVTQAIAKMIIVDMLPISFVSNAGFHDFMGVVEPNYTLPCAKTIRSRIVHAYEQVAAKVAAALMDVPFVAWTSDCWSSRSQDSYISVMVHFFNAKWIPDRYTLSTEELSERHTAANLTERLQKILLHWQLEGKVRNLDGLAVTTGVTCAAHSLQLCVTNSLKNVNGAALCEKASRIVAHFRHSNISTTALEGMQQQLGLKKLKLIQCCVTRWDSTFAMIERLLTNRRAVMNVLTDRAYTKPAVAQRLEVTETEWLSLEKLQQILKPLQVATTVLCSDSHSPISMVRPIVFMLRDGHLRDAPDDEIMISEMKGTLRNELTARFDLDHDSILGVNARQVASFLDPRYKDLVVESAEAREDIRLFVRGLLVDETADEQDDGDHATAMDFLFQSVSKPNNAETQVTMYLTEPQIGHNMDAFEWWASREKRYPALANLARKYLCIHLCKLSKLRASFFNGG